MRLYQLLRSTLTSLLLFLCVTHGNAQIFYPTEDNPKTRSLAVIEMGKGYVSGVCLLKKDGALIYGSIFNEFGISALSFTYNEAKGKVKLHDVVSFLNKWYIRMVFRRDIARWMQELKGGNSSYVNTHRKITYRLMPLDV